MQTQMTPYFIVSSIRIKCRTESAHCFRGATFDHRSKRQLILTCKKRQLSPPTFDPRVGQDQLSVGSNVPKTRIECRYLGSYVVGIKCRWYQLSPHQSNAFPSTHLKKVLPVTFWPVYFCTLFRAFSRIRVVSGFRS